MVPLVLDTTGQGFDLTGAADGVKFDIAGDGVIDTKDAVFNSLRLWIDSNHDGICQPN